MITHTHRLTHGIVRTPPAFTLFSSWQSRPAQPHIKPRTSLTNLIVDHTHTHPHTHLNNLADKKNAHSQDRHRTHATSNAPCETKTHCRDDKGDTHHQDISTHSGSSWYCSPLAWNSDPSSNPKDLYDAYGGESEDANLGIG